MFVLSFFFFIFSVIQLSQIAMKSSEVPSLTKSPYIQRINKIRDSVTKEQRIPFVSNRLQKCFTRTKLYQWHCIIAFILAIILGLMFYDLPTSRSGIEKRENLFRVIVFSILLFLLFFSVLFVYLLVQLPASLIQETLMCLLMII